MYTVTVFLSEVEGLDPILADQAWESTGSEDSLEILRQDAHRLAASAV
jgi:hypothetical protein